MKRWTIVVVAAISAAAPSVAAAQSPTRQDMAVYHRLYDQAAKRFGKLSGAQGGPGCELGRTCHQVVTHEALVASEAVLRRMIDPVAYTPSVSHSVVYQPVHHYYHSSYSHSTYHSSYSAPVQSAPTYSSGGAGGVPACASESGTNYSTGPLNTNGSSGATGRYQITPSTAANYGCNLSTPGGQDACAQTIYAHQGASAWVGCGG